MPKVLLFRFEQCLGPFIMMLFKGFSETGLFRYLSNHGFLSPAFRKDISYEGHLYFENFQFLLIFQKFREKVEKTFSLEEIIASQLPVSNCLF